MPEKPEKPAKQSKAQKQNIFEALLKEMSFQFNPDDYSFTLKLPVTPQAKPDEPDQKPSTTTKETTRIPVSDEMHSTSSSKSSKVKKVVDSSLSPSSASKNLNVSNPDDFDIEYEDLNISDTNFNLEGVDSITDDFYQANDPVRVKIQLKAYIKLALHARSTPILLLTLKIGLK